MAELSVSRKTISKLFTEMQDKKFLIPEYQRPYKWDEEKCETLWEDITTFHENVTEADDYFLGTIVSYKDGKNVQIIDGQQRVTSFFLMLRAFYKKLEEMVEDENVVGLKNQIGPCIWNVDPISQRVSNKKQIHIESLVATDEDRENFHSILETGIINAADNDLYSINYRFFYNKCQEYAKNNPMQWQPLCVTILQKCIVLPIECDIEETALRIFTTLNDRGMPLSDSDIFKAQIYKIQSTEAEKSAFTQTWKELTSICKSAGISLDDIFRYYTHILRAINSDKSKEVALRRFYAEDKYARLKYSSLIPDLMKLANLWLYINTGKKSDDLNVEFNTETRKYLHSISKYPNEFWKYITSVYFLRNDKNDNFEIDFLDYLKKLTAFLFVKFIAKPTVNAVKDDIYNACIVIQQTGKINFAFAINEEEFKARLGLYSSSKLTRGLILLHAYLNDNQIDLLPDSFDIEHIFPRKWQTANYFGWDEKEAQIHLEQFGNKVAIEKKLNIQAGNGYFGNKKLRYAQSKVQNVLELSNHANSDWNKVDIVQREKDFRDKMCSFFTAHLN